MMNISRLTRRSAIAGLGLVALAACSGEEEEPAVADAQEAPEEQEASDGDDDTDDDTEDDTEDAAPAGDETEVEIGHEFEDPDTGDQFTVISAVRNVPVEDEDAAKWVEEGGEVIYLQVKVVPGEEFGGGINGRDFAVKDDNSIPVSDAEGELEDSDREIWDRPQRSDGEFTGWIPLIAEVAEDSYTAVYTRPEADVIGGDEDSLEEFSEEFEIPAA